MSDAARARRPMSLEEWAALDEDQPGELVDGYLEEEEMPSFVHELLVAAFCAYFRGWIGRGGLVVGSSSKLGLSERRGRKPDVAAWFPGSALPRGDASMSRLPPDVALEVVTPTPRDARRDRVTKHDEYAAFGVRFYWIVDPVLRTVEVFALRDGGYTRVLGATEGVVPVPGIEEATLDLDALWHEVDELLRHDGDDGSS